MPLPVPLLHLLVFHSGVITHTVHATVISSPRFQVCLSKPMPDKVCICEGRRKTK